MISSCWCYVSGDLRGCVASGSAGLSMPSSSSRHLICSPGPWCPHPGHWRPDYLSPAGLNSGVSGPNAVGASVVSSKIPVFWRFVLLAWV